MLRREKANDTQSMVCQKDSVWHHEFCFACKSNVQHLPPAAFNNEPCSKCSQQRVECVNVTGSNGEAKAQEKSCSLLHRWTWLSKQAFDTTSTSQHDLVLWTQAKTWPIKLREAVWKTDIYCVGLVTLMYSYSTHLELQYSCTVSYVTHYTVLRINISLLLSH